MRLSRHGRLVGRRLQPERPLVEVVAVGVDGLLDPLRRALDPWVLGLEAGRGGLEPLGGEQLRSALQYGQGV